MRLSVLLDRVSMQISRQADQLLQEQLGIGMSQFRVLLLLDNTATLSQRIIADRLQQTEASISRQIQLLLEKGLVQRTIPTNNRRQHNITITGKGLKLKHAAIDVLERQDEAILARLIEKDRKRLLSLLSEVDDTTKPNLTS